MVELREVVDGKKPGVVCVLVNTDSYATANLELLKLLSGDKGRRGVYITANRRYSDIVLTLEENKLDHESLFFIDMVSAMSGNDTGACKNCLFVDAPDDLTELGIALSNAVRDPSENTFIILDSISSLVSYNTKERVIKFLHHLANRTRMWNAKCMLIYLEREADKHFLEQVAHFCDNVVRA